jgi:hypothetical protein
MLLAFFLPERMKNLMLNTALRTTIFASLLAVASFAYSAQLVYNGDFELVPSGWSEISALPLVDEHFIGSLGLTGNRYAWLAGYSNANDVLSQSVDFGSITGSGILTFKYEKLVVESNSFDFLTVKVGSDVVDVINLGGVGFGFSGVLLRTVDLSSYVGSGAKLLSFEATTDSSLASSIFLDNVAINTIPIPEPSTLMAIITGAIIVRLRRIKKS